MSLNNQELKPQFINDIVGEPIGNFVPSDALNIPEDEPAGVSLKHSLVQVTRREIEGGAEYTAEFDHPPLQGDSLFRFLDHMAPGSFFESTGGVYDDWILPDVDRRRAVFKAPFGDKLLQMHTEALGRHWQDFEQSRIDLIDAILSGHNPESLLSEFKCKQVALYDESEVRQRLDAAKLDFPMLRRIFSGGEFPDPTATMASFMLEDGTINEKTFHLILRGNKRQTISSIFDRDRDSYRNRYLAEMDEQQTEAAYDGYIKDQYVQIVTEDGSIRYIYKTHAYSASQEALQQAYNNRQPLKIVKPRGPVIPKPTSYVIDEYMLDTKNGPKQVVFPSTLRPSEESLALQPVLQWRTFTTATGEVKRELVVDNQASPSPEDWPVDQPKVKVSKLAGLLALAHISPDLVKSWPKSIKVSDEWPAQGMGPAQLPVLALMKSNSLLKSSAIEFMESLS